MGSSLPLAYNDLHHDFLKLLLLITIDIFEHLDPFYRTADSAVVTESKMLAYLRQGLATAVTG